VSAQTGTRTSAVLLEELSALLGFTVRQIRWAPPSREPGCSRGWWFSIGEGEAARGIFLESSDSLRDPRRLNGWRAQVLNWPTRSARREWIDLPPLGQADGRKVARLAHEIVEATVTEGGPR